MLWVMTGYAMTPGKTIVHEVAPHGTAGDGLIAVKCGRPEVTLRVTGTPEPGASAFLLEDGTTAQARMCKRCTRDYPGGVKTSFWLNSPMFDRRARVKELTGYPDVYIFEFGLTTIENDLEVVLANAEIRRKVCGHPARYPNGRCRYCFEPPPRLVVSKEPYRPPGPLFTSIHRR